MAIDKAPLFHSKAYLIEGNKHGKILLGSMNLTTRGISQNEELVFFDDYEINSSSNTSKLAKWIKSYTSKLLSSSQKVEKAISKTIKITSLRQLLLNGKIYYVNKEQDPFRFKLHLPESIVKQKTDLHKELESNVVDSISLARLIPEEIIRTNSKNISNHDVKSRWKRYCAETCYGYWNPIMLQADLQKSLDKLSEYRRPYYESIISNLLIYEDKIRDIFESIRCQINNKLHEKKIDDWKYSDQVIAANALDNWFESLKTKSVNLDYLERLISGISCAETPDVWNDPVSAEEFENSFCESIIYYWSKPQKNVSSNVIAKKLAEKLSTYNQINTSDNLNKAIVRWHIRAPYKDIFGNVT